MLLLPRKWAAKGELVEFQKLDKLIVEDGEDNDIYLLLAGSVSIVIKGIEYRSLLPLCFRLLANSADISAPTAAPHADRAGSSPLLELSVCGGSIRLTRPFPPRSTTLAPKAASSPD